jgi:tRNA A37 threonylcarbamoyladenosine synthetase subunit TsaC/SUA5/YrdC
LSISPVTENFLERIATVKGEKRGQTPPLSLVKDFETAKQYWKQLPDAWSLALTKIWPCHLSVVYDASESCPKKLSANGLVGLRVSEGLSPMMQKVLENVGLPWPSTSVNTSGHKAIADYSAAVDFVRAATTTSNLPFGFLPASFNATKSSGPSSILKISGPTSGIWLRKSTWAEKNKHVLPSFGLNVGE